MKKKIFISEPLLDKKDRLSILKCIDSGFISSVGKNVVNFENEIKKITKSKYCVACINGTSALQISLKLLGVKKNDEVIAPTMSFVATINSILYNNASPVFMDCDQYLNIDIKKTLEFIRFKTVTKNKKTFNKKSKKRIKVIIIAHMYGNLCDFSQLKKICVSKGIKILEDAAESVGSFYKNGVHSGTVGDLGCFSFNGNKIITSGGGGAIVLENKTLADKARKYINQSKSESIEYIHDDIGYNYRLSNLHASLGISQIKKLKRFIKKKKYIYQEYKRKFISNINFEILKNNQISLSNNWINILQIKNDKIDKSKLLSFLIKNGIEARPIWHPLHLQKYCKNYEIFKIKQANNLHKKCICLPSSINLKINEIKKVVKIINEYKN